MSQTTVYPSKKTSQPTRSNVFMTISGLRHAGQFQMVSSLLKSRSYLEELAQLTVGQSSIMSNSHRFKIKITRMKNGCLEVTPYEFNDVSSYSIFLVDVFTYGHADLIGQLLTREKSIANIEKISELSNDGLWTFVSHCRNFAVHGSHKVDEPYNIIIVGTTTE